MRTVLALQVATLLSVSIPGMAASVEYQHPDLTIVAKQEPLGEVLKSLGKELRIYITVPTGLNPMVSCDIQHQPIKQAFKTLLGDMSYSLEWEEKTGQLVGLTILAGGEELAISNKPSQSPNVSQSTPAPTPVDHGDHDTVMADHDAHRETTRAEHEARMEADRAEQEARMVEERAAQEERMKEEVARHEAEMRVYIESQGLTFPD